VEPLTALAHAIAARDDPVVLAGITGGVAAGKSTTAALLRDELARIGVTAEVLCTDCFLFPNTVLAERGLTMRKGFPGTFDDDTIADVLDALLAGTPVDLPVYSHATYDIVAGERHPLSPPRVVIVEGVNALWSPIRERLHLAVYLDADDDDVRTWFLTRFEELCATATPDSFYAALAALPADQQRAIADSAWRDINLVNLRDYIGPTRAHATHVLQIGRASCRERV